MADMTITIAGDDLFARVWLDFDVSYSNENENEQKYLFIE